MSLICAPARDLRARFSDNALLYLQYLSQCDISNMRMFRFEVEITHMRACYSYLYSSDCVLGGVAHRPTNWVARRKRMRFRTHHFNRVNNTSRKLHVSAHKGRGGFRPVALFARRALDTDPSPGRLHIAHYP